MYPNQLPTKPTKRGRATDDGAARRLRIPVSNPTPQELWPVEADLILSALDAGKSGDANRRLGSRLPYRVRAMLKLFSEQHSPEPYVLYTRDVDQRGFGFITPNRLPLGYGGEVELFTPRGNKLRVHCTLLRCRQAAPGWFEGAAYFNREQWVFQVE
jgi:hypothetical protein